MIPATREACSIASLLQEFFIVTYVVLAPFVNEFADALPKGRAMFWANAVKLSGTAAMCSGLCR
jgi:hypothetical protein